MNFACVFAPVGENDEWPGAGNRALRSPRRFVPVVVGRRGLLAW